jgi:hypothetical protein
MKHTFYIFLSLLLLTTSAAAQSLTNKSVAELNKIKSDAITKEDFDLANKVTEELKLRKTIEELIEGKNTELNSAVALEDYDKAEQIKKEIAQLKANKIKIEQLEIDKKTAITLEDYDKVIEIDKEIKKLSSLKRKNDRPLSTEKEIDFIINYYEKDILEFDKPNGKYKFLNKDQKQKHRKPYREAINSFKDIKAKIATLTEDEENGMHYSFLTILRLDKDPVLMAQYYQYYLAEVTRNTPYTDIEKINTIIDVSSNRIKNLNPETPYYQKSIDANNAVINANNYYLQRVNQLTAVDKQVINMYFDAAIFSSDLPLDLESVNRFFK